jgi:hypothetical protein
MISLPPPLRFGSSCEACLLHAANTPTSPINCTLFNGVIVRNLLLMIIDMPTLDTASHPRDMTKMLHRRRAGNSQHDGCLRAHVRKRCGAGEKSKYQELGVRRQAKQRVEM